MIPFADIDPNAWVDAWNRFSNGNPVLARATTFIAYVMLAAMALFLVVVPLVQRVIVPLVEARGKRGNGKNGGDS